MEQNPQLIEKTNDLISLILQLSDEKLCNSLNFYRKSPFLLSYIIKSMSILNQININNSQISSAHTKDNLHGLSRMSLFLDIDETIAHKRKGSSNCNDIILRPGIHNFLSNITKKYDVYIFTAASKNHADQILRRIDPCFQYFKKVFYRDSCKIIDQFYFKDLSFLNGSINLSKTVIVDDNLVSFGMNLENGILIKPFLGNMNDQELIYLEKYLDLLTKYSDVRIPLQESFHLNSLKQFVFKLYSSGSLSN